GRLGAEHVLSPLDDVEIELEDAALAHARFEHRRENRLLPLAKQAALPREKEVLRELLRDGRAPGDDLAAPLVLLQRALDAFPVETVVLDELGVLGDYDGPLQLG